ncbi:MAG: GNAT family N-acetyltransferase [Micromonosporaceae bacterium]
MSADDTLVRPASSQDAPEIARIAAANGQPSQDSGRDPRYVAHLARHGRLLVAQAGAAQAGGAQVGAAQAGAAQAGAAQAGGRLDGFAATRQIGEVTFLCDLFVDPAIHGKGTGRRLLNRAFGGTAQRATFSSQDPRALPLYVSFGLVPRWPLLYLSGDTATLTRAPGEFRARRTEPVDAAAAEKALTGVDREPDYLYWAATRGGGALVVEQAGAVIAAGAVTESILVHLAVDDAADQVTALLATLETLTSPRIRLCLPGPHPALGTLLRAGFRIDDFDHYMSTSENLIGAHWVLSPALA